MKEFLLLLPIIYIIHDMEEIIGFGWFFRRNPWVYKNYPKVTKSYLNFKTDIFAVGVYEEFIPSVITSIIFLPICILILTFCFVHWHMHKLSNSNLQEY